MSMLRLCLLAISMIGVSACKQEKFSAADMALKELPHWSIRPLELSGFNKSYQFDTSINPFYLNIDVDGNGSIDLAAVIVERSSGRRGVAILQHDSDTVQIFGAGNHNTLGGVNWNWMVGWKAEERLTARSEVHKNIGTAFILYTETGTIKCMYWDGKEWEWVEQ